MVKLSILSLLDNTNFSGDIVVLSDSIGIPDDILLRTGRVNVIDIITHIPDLSNRKINRFNIFCLKPFIVDFVDMSKYKFCLYVDADVLFNMPTLDETLNYFASIGKIQISDNDGWVVSRRHHTTGSQILTEGEILSNGNFGVCAGVLGLPCNNLGISLLNDWKKLNIEGKFELDDQGNLTALLIRKYKNDYIFMPFLNKNRWIMKDITHYCSGNSKPMFWHHSRAILRKYKVNLPELSGQYIMNKPDEGLTNVWSIDDSIVFVDNPAITGFVQKTVFGYYVWWLNGEGFEKISADLSICKSFRNGDFTLSKYLPNDGQHKL